MYNIGIIFILFLFHCFIYNICFDKKDLYSCNYLLFKFLPLVVGRSLINDLKWTLCERLFGTIYRIHTYKVLTVFFLLKIMKDLIRMPTLNVAKSTIKWNKKKSAPESSFVLLFYIIPWFYEYRFKSVMKCVTAIKN